jgi:hypothetical protein
MRQSPRGDFGGRLTSAGRNYPDAEVAAGTGPVRVLLRQAPDQNPDLSWVIFGLPPRGRDRRAPVQAKARPMPGDDGVWYDDSDDINPTRPEAPQSSPEQPVERVQPGSRSFSFQDGDLLPEGDNLQGGIGPGAEVDAEGSEESEDEMEHEFHVVT